MSTPTPTASTHRGGVEVGELVAGLTGGLEPLVGVDVDRLDEQAIHRVMAAEEQAIRRLQAHQSRLSATLTRRRAARARAERPDDPRAPQKAARQVRSEMTDGLGITPSRAKQVTRTGRQLEHLPATAAAYADGRLTDRHVAVIDEVTAHVAGDERDRFEAELVALADRTRDAVVFGREARRRLIDRDHDAAMADLQRRKARRSGRVAQTADGTTLLRLDTAGYDGELVHTVVDAFRTPDAAGHQRTAEQRTHDAIIAAFETALRTGAASTQHGVRPQVALVLRAESLRDGDGAADTRWTGPLPHDEVARVLGDCALTRIVADAADTPLSVSKQVRTVPVGLWQDLVVRDGGCIWEGCDAPPGWCQVAHLETPYHKQGRLSPQTAGLLCTAGPNHHARYDHHGYGVDWIDGRPRIRTPDGRPLADQRRGRWADPPEVASRARDRPPAAPDDERPDADHPPDTGDPGDPDDPPAPPTLFARESRGAYRVARPSGRPRPPGSRRSSTTAQRSAGRAPSR